MIRKVVFIIIVIIGVTVVATNLPLIFAADTRVRVDSQVMAPAMALNPEKIELQIGDTVTWVNLTGHGIKLNPDWEEAAPLPPYIQPGGTVQLQFGRPGTYRYSIFTATDRFEEDRVPVKISGAILVNPRASTP
jgi:plastocyanin